MESKVIETNKNPFLGREEILLEVKSEVAPSFEDIKKEVGKDESLVVVKKIGGNFGKHLFNVEVFVYESVEAKEKVETIPQKVRKKMEADKKAAEEAKRAEEEAAAKAKDEAAAAEAEAPAEETPAEEVKEEEKVEEVKESEKTE